MTELSRRDFFHAGVTSLGVVALANAGQAGSSSSTESSFHYDHVCGTSLDVWFRAGQDTDAEARVLAEVDRLTAIFSLYDANSELSRFNRSTGTVAVSPDLCHVLKQYETWQIRTAGSCNSRVGAFVEVWTKAERLQQVPSAGELAEVAREIARPGFVLNELQGTASKSGSYPLNLNAIAKGYIVGRMVEVLRSTAGVVSGLVNLGGDMAAFGDSYSVAVQDPFHPAENERPLGQFSLQNAAVATSGGYQRFYTIHGEPFSHLIDPRSGRPAESVASATVTASSSVTANVLATTLGVMGVEEGLRLMATVPGAECLLVDREGKQFRSPGFALQPMPTSTTAEFRDEDEKAWPKGYQATVALELPTIAGGRYRRPYVAVWVENSDGKPVRTLAVWGNAPKYLKDLTDWWAFAKDNKTLRAVTRATRGPGKYSIVWDGKDDAGKAVSQGTYTVRVEVHREHGKHLRQSGKLECLAEGSTVKLDKNDETAATVVTYGAKK